MARTGFGRSSGRQDSVCTHPNGTTFTPALRRSLAQRQDVAEVWALGSVQHGDAGISNARKSDPMPSALPIISGRFRKAYALGHSSGGCARVLAASHYPDLFTAVAPVHAVIAPPELDRAISRPPAWVAHNGLVSTAHPLLRTWDRNVLDVYVKQALVEEEAGGKVRLKCDKIDEAAVYAEARASWEAWGALPLLDERVSLLVVQTREFATARVRRRAVTNAHVVIPNGTHLAVQTHPRQIAEAVQVFLQPVDGSGPGYACELKLPKIEAAMFGQRGPRAHL
ncbi:hypothetical protein PENSPDRAFT_670991 [Peniophora sp. CONT]|nr:hypothetical protein PENSPDRAFT_670991 [Peniophora sp. CONT]